MKFFNIATFFTLPTLSEIANIYNDNNEINDEIQTGYKVCNVNERIKCYNITNCFTLPTLTEIANIYNINDEIQTGNIIQDGIMISGVN
jgi:hypothetical protein